MKSKLFLIYLFIVSFLFAASSASHADDSRELREIISIITKSGKKELNDRPIRKTGSRTDTASGITNKKETAAPVSGPDRALLDSGIQLFEASLFDNAKKAFEDLRKNYPDSPYRDSASIWLAKLHIRSGNFDEAGKVLNTIGNESGEYPAALFLIGDIHLKTGNDTYAIDQYYKIVTNFPDNELTDDSLLAISGIYLKNKKGNQALEPLIKIILEYPDRETLDDAYYNLAEIFEKDISLRDFSTARKIYRIFINKAKIKKEPVFLNSPLLEMAEINLASIEKKYFGKLIAE